MVARRRLDAELVRRRITSSRGEAVAAIDARRVLVNGSIALKPAHQVAPGDAVELVGPPPRYVGRGGEKLDAALSSFGLDVTGMRFLDAGASTGGFTDCLLQRGAAHVVALDVGHGQLHERIRADPRVTVLERENIRTATVELIAGVVDGVVADLSFISLGLVAPTLVELCQPGGPMVLLVKPQFEAGRSEVSRGGGVISDPEIHRRVCDGIDVLLAGLGCTVLGWIESPIVGADGNREFLVHASTPEPPA
jgi:23S rRNA (cytidine1920-2'-O)/16S rRNA (cytidine1409-2'-O)-methyltransferase